MELTVTETDSAGTLELPEATKALIDSAATMLLGAGAQAQTAFLTCLAMKLYAKGREALAYEVNSFASEEESIALCRLARAINERDAGPDIEDDC